MRRPTLLLVAVTLLVTAACGGDSQGGGGGGGGDGATGQTSVTLLTDFFANGNQAVFYTAIAQGFFEEEGLDVSIEHILGGTEVIKTLVAGEAEFGYADFASMAVANQNEDAGLQAIMGIQEQTPMAIMAPAESGIAEPADLPGNTIVDFAGSSTQIVWPVFLAENGLAEGDMELELVDPATRLSLVSAGRADASVGFFTNNEPELRDQCGCDVNTIKWKDYGIDALSNGLMVSTEYMEQNRDQVEGFVRAMAQAIEFARTNPEQTAQDLIDAQGEEVGAEDVVLAQLQNMLTLTTTPSGGGDPTGLMTEEDWQATIDLMVEVGQMDAPEDISTFYTNDFIPGAA
ncbi:MAG: ABC transporter substrate-binding protein [Actinomycetota bacterium]